MHTSREKGQEKGERRALLRLHYYPQVTFLCESGYSRRKIAPFSGISHYLLIFQVGLEPEEIEGDTRKH